MKRYYCQDYLLLENIVFCNIMFSCTNFDTNNVRKFFKQEFSQMQLESTYGKSVSILLWISRCFIWNSWKTFEIYSNMNFLRILSKISIQMLKTYKIIVIVWSLMLKLTYIFSISYYHRRNCSEIQLTKWPYTQEN